MGFENIFNRLSVVDAKIILNGFMPKNVNGETNNFLSVLCMKE